MKTLQKILIPLILILLLLTYGCEKSVNIIDSELKQDFVINSGDMLNIDLGVFGDEEGVIIYLNPFHAKINQIERPLYSSAIYYKYMPNDNFIGNDSVSLIINKGSNGTINSGNRDTTTIRIIVTN